jgi:hypothetical protein
MLLNATTRQLALLADTRVDSQRRRALTRREPALLEMHQLLLAQRPQPKRTASRTSGQASRSGVRFPEGRPAPLSAVGLSFQTPETTRVETQ